MIGALGLGAPIVSLSARGPRFDIFVKATYLTNQGEPKMTDVSRRFLICAASSVASVFFASGAGAQEPIKSAITTPVPNGYVSFGGPITVQSMSALPGVASDSLISRKDELRPSPITHPSIGALLAAGVANAQQDPKSATIPRSVATVDVAIASGHNEDLLSGGLEITFSKPIESNKQ